MIMSIEERKKLKEAHKLAIATEKEEEEGELETVVSSYHQDGMSAKDAEEPRDGLVLDRFDPLLPVNEAVFEQDAIEGATLEPGSLPSPAQRSAVDSLSASQVAGGAVRTPWAAEVQAKRRRVEVNLDRGLRLPRQEAEGCSATNQAREDLQGTHTGRARLKGALA